jgi:hypothetical protein
MQKINLKYLALIGLVVLCVIVFFLIKFYNTGFIFSRNDNTNIQLPEAPAIPDSSNNNEETTQAPQTVNDVLNTSPSLLVSWIEPKEIPALPVFGPNARVNKVVFYEVGKASKPSNSNFFTVYRVEYWNETEMPFFSYDYLLGEKDPNGVSKYYLIEKNSTYSLTAYDEYFKKYPTENYQTRLYTQNVTPFLQNYVLPLGFPKELRAKNGAILSLVQYSSVNENFNTEGLTLAFADENVGNVYYKKGKTSNAVSVYDRGVFYVKAPDGSLRVYEIVGPKFIGSPSDSDKKSGFVLENGLTPKSL